MKDNKPEKKDGRDWAKIITLMISLIALALSITNYYDANMREDVIVTVARRARLQVAVLSPDKWPMFRPTIFLNLCFMNRAGRAVVIMDSRIHVELSTNGQITYSGVFLPEGEVPNIVTAGGQVDYQLVPPIPLLGRSSINKQVAYVGGPDFDGTSVRDTFDIGVTLDVQQGTEWRTIGKYRSTDVAAVWDDLLDTAKISFNRAHPDNAKIIFHQAYVDLAP
ncbi:MAG: hypothetical protein HY851_07990 [candidate division Zixibacteria bacterium]|nr:hypothetical protein [candidate division Zixibacteria bacterium]